jgi:pimeloyl-ACP methyl ester carboxylesterase
MNNSRVAYGVLGAAVTVAAAGAGTAGLMVRRRRRANRTEAPPRFERFHPDRQRTVHTEDGVPLEVFEIGPADAELTVVFSHGFALTSRAFYYQERALREKFGDRIRIVLYDQRGHGESGPSVPASATIEQLGHDLYGVLDAVVPTGPVVLVGHSMGGMTILSLAECYPRLFQAEPGRLRRARAPRVAGVALLCTSSGGLADSSLGLPGILTRLRGPLAPALLRTARRRAVLVEHGRRIGADLAWVFTRRMSFATSDISPATVDFLHEMIAATHIEAIADFYPSLMTFSGAVGLPVLADTDVVIVGAEKDVMTPIGHSEVIAEALPDAEFVALPAVGHVAILEQPGPIDQLLIELVERALKDRS